MPKIKSYTPQIGNKPGNIKPIASPGVTSPAPSTDMLTPQQIGNVGQSLSQIGERLLAQGLQQDYVFAQRRDKGVVGDALRKANTEAMNHYAELPQDGTKDSTNIYNPTKEVLAGMQEVYLSELENDNQKELFKSNFGGTVVTLLNKTKQREQNSILMYEENSRKALNANALDMAVLSKPGNPADEKAYSEMGNHWRTIENNTIASYGRNASDVDFKELSSLDPAERGKALARIRKNNPILDRKLTENQYLFYNTVLNDYLREDPRKAAQFLALNSDKFDPQKYDTMKIEVNKLAFNTLKNEFIAKAVENFESLEKAELAVNRSFKTPERRQEVKKDLGSAFKLKDDRKVFDEKLKEKKLVAELTVNPNMPIPPNARIEIQNKVKAFREDQQKEVIGGEKGRADYVATMNALGRGIVDQEIDLKKAGVDGYRTLVNRQAQYLSGEKVDKFDEDADKLALQRLSVYSEFDPKSKDGEDNREHFFQEFDKLKATFPKDQKAAPDVRAKIISMIDELFKPVTVVDAGKLWFDAPMKAYAIPYLDKELRKESLELPENIPSSLKSIPGVKWDDLRGAYVQKLPNGTEKFFDRDGKNIGR